MLGLVLAVSVVGSAASQPVPESAGIFYAGDGVNKLYKLDPQKGTAEPLAGLLVEEMTYDAQHDQLYVLNVGYFIGRIPRFYLATINPHTGEGSNIRWINLPLTLPLGPRGGLAYDNQTGFLYAIGSEFQTFTRRLYRIDPLTGLVDLVGGSWQFPGDIGLAFSPNGKLYLLRVGIDNTSISELDKETGEATHFVGPTPTSQAFAFGAFDDTVYLLHKDPYGNGTRLYAENLATLDSTSVYFSDVKLTSLAIVLPPSPIPTAIAMSLPASIVQGDRTHFDGVAVAATDGSTPTGTVQLTFSGFGTFSHTLAADGATKYTLHSLPVGTYQVQASYPAQGRYAASKSDVQTLMVVAGPPPSVSTNTALNIPVAIIQGDRGHVATVSVTTSDGSLAPGTVQLTFSGFGTFTHTLMNGSTQYTLYSLPPGTYQLQASYPRQGNDAASQSGMQTLTVLSR
jgi:hypothetical protein